MSDSPESPFAFLTSGDFDGGPNAFVTVASQLRGMRREQLVSLVDDIRQEREKVREGNEALRTALFIAETFVRTLV